MDILYTSRVGVFFLSADSCSELLMVGEDSGFSFDLTKQHFFHKLMLSVPAHAGWWFLETHSMKYSRKFIFKKLSKDFLY